MRHKPFRLFLLTIILFLAFKLIIYTVESPQSDKTQQIVLDSKSAPLFHVVKNREFEDAEVEQQRRIARINTVCQDVSRGNTENILMYKPKNMSYCVIPKNGCTFWIRVMRFLNKDTEKKKISSPFDISRFEAHGWRYNQTLYRLQNTKHRDLIFKSTRFLVSRDPYSKLLSGYMDKLFLPMYWTYKGTEMIKRVRKGPSDLSMKCGHDLSFQEYLDYLLTEQNDPTKIDGHFRPTQFYCSPCIFKPHFVAKQESFKKDSEYILEKFGLSDIVKSYDHKSHVKDELRILLTDYLGWANSKAVKECLGKKEFFLRIWKTFQINGYLPLGSESAIETMETSKLTADVFKKAVFDSFTKEQLNHQKMRDQRRRMMAKMYRNVSRTTLENIAKMFDVDFRLFGYESHPSDIFS